jgi:dihydrofolate synthase/folylpolyglutamate synthase
MDRDFDAVAYTAPVGNELHATFDYKVRQNSLKSRTGMQLGLLGRHQARNAALALTVLDLLSADGWKWDDRVVRRALAEVCCRGRVELISRNPFLVVDAAHNVASIQALLDTLEELAFGESRILLFSSSVDKDLEGMLRLLVPRFDHVILTRYLGSRRAADPNQLAEIVQQINTTSSREGITWEVQHDPNVAWNVARDRLAGGGAVCVTGSFFIAAHLRRLAQQADLSGAAHRSQCRQQPGGQRAVRLGT